MNHTRFVNKMYLINPGLQSKTCAARHNWNRHNLSSWPSLSPVISRFSSFALLFKTVIITVGRPAGLNRSDNFIQLLNHLNHLYLQTTSTTPFIELINILPRTKKVVCKLGITLPSALSGVFTQNACLGVDLRKISFKTLDEPKVTKIGLISVNFWLDFSADVNAHLKLEKNNSASKFTLFCIELVNVSFSDNTETGERRGETGQ